MNRKLKLIFVYYLLSAVCMAVTVSGAIVSFLYSSSEARTLAQLQAIRVNGAKMKNAAREIEKITAALSTMLPAKHESSNIEPMMLESVDAVSARLKNAVMTVGDFSRDEDRVVLPIVLTGVFKNYGSFVRDVDYLQSMTFPFMFVESLTLSKTPSEEREGVHYTVKGYLKMHSSQKVAEHESEQ